MALSVIKARLEMNGVNIVDIDSITPGGYTKSVQVPLMHKTNTGLTTPRHTVQVGFVEPAAGFALDPKNIENGTLTYELDNGKRFTYGGVYTGEIGDGTIDMENAYKYTITFNCESLTEE